ncbi:ead/Ea22-like family protein [Klebsiella michiganensis]|uniref:ead/Ea22-like family protein n=1 Tax=Klebsiella michiganensis TaxID=1134687 RepID=UPI0039843C26
MTTDITELAQSLKAAAENAIGAHERLAAYPYGEIIDISQHEGEQIDIDITDLNEFNKEANPVNILALVEALEKAQAQSSAWLEAYHKAVSVGARYEERIAELEPIRAAAEKLVRCKGRYHSEQNYRALAALFGVTIPDLPPLDGKSRTVNAAAANVLAERKRQVSVEGWTPSHDDAHKNNEMAFAAACYAFHAAAASWDLEDCGTEYDSHPAPKNWPWEPEWWKPKSARADLVRAGALILAELERIDRAAGIREAE